MSSKPLTGEAATVIDPVIAWILEHPRITITTVVSDDSKIEVRAEAAHGLNFVRTDAHRDGDGPTFSRDDFVWTTAGGAHRVWAGKRALPLSSPLSALRDAYDELTREGHLALEALIPNRKEG